MSFSEWSNAKKKKEQEEQKKEQTANTKAATGISFSEWSEKKKYSHVDEKYLNEFISDINTVASADEATSYGTWNSLDLGNKVTNVRGWLNYNKEKLDAETYKGLSDVVDYAENALDFYSQFGSDEEYAKWYNEKSYYQKYAGKSYDEILDMSGIRQYYENDKSTGLDFINDGQRDLARVQNPEFQWLSDNIYSLLYNANDFEEGSKYVSTANGGSMEYNPWTGQFQGTGFDDVNYDYINRNPNAVSEKSSKATVSGLTFAGVDDAELETMTDQEVAIFNYLYANAGQRAAYSYVKSILTDLNARERAKNSEWWAKYAEESPIEASVFSVLTSPLKSISYVGQVGDYLDDGSIDQNEGYNKFSHMNSAIRNEVSENIEEKWGGVGSFAYQTGMSMADFLFNTAITGGSEAFSLAIMGTSAAADTVIASKDMGLSDDQAFLLGTAAGAIEVATEKIGIDALFDTKALSGSVGGYILQNLLAEGTEEGLSDIGNTLVELIDLALSGDESKIKREIYAIMQEQNVDEGTAIGKYIAGKFKELGLDVLGGAISGGVMGSGGVGFNSIGTTIQGSEYKGVGIDADLVGEALEIDPNNSYAQKMQGKVDSGKTLSSYQLGKLVQQNESALVSQDQAKMRSSVEARLTELGETGNISKLADALVKQASGEDLTMREKAILRNSKMGNRVANELNPDNINSGEYSSSWAEGIGTERINAESYNKALYDLATEKAGLTVAEETPSVTVNATGKEIATEGEFKASEDGKTKLGDTEVSIKEIASVKDGKLTLRLEDGSTVSASDIEFGSSEEGLLYENVVHMGLNAATANAFINGYDGKIPVSEYALDFRQAYRYGELGIPKSEINSEGYSSSLSESQKSLAYDLGKTDAKYKAEKKQSEKGKIASTGTINADKNAQKGKKSGKLHNTLTPHNETQRASLKALGVVAESLGIDIYTFESKVDADGRRTGANGWYNAKDNSIHIDLYAGVDGKGTMLFTAAHELTHHIREKLPAKFKAFADFLFEQYGEKGISVSELIAEKREFLENNGRITPDMSEAQAYDLAYEEVVADACESFLADGEAVAKIAELKAKDKTLWQTIKDFITNLVARIKAAYEGLNPDSREGRLVAEMLDSAEKLQKMWTEMVIEASEVSTLDGKNNTKSYSKDSAVSTSTKIAENDTGKQAKIDSSASVSEAAKAESLPKATAPKSLDVSEINDIEIRHAMGNTGINMQVTDALSPLIKKYIVGDIANRAALAEAIRSEFGERIGGFALNEDNLIRLANIIDHEAVKYREKHSVSANGTLSEASGVETATEILGKNGIAVDSKTDSATLYSVRDVLNDADRKKVSKTLAERFGVTQSEAMDWLKAETSLSSLILNPKYSKYLDYTADPNEEAIKSNSDYPQGTVDFSNICKKRRDFTEVMNRVLRNFPDHVFAATDLAKIRTIMEEEGMEVACAICYVEDRRQLDSVVAQDFIDSLKIYREGGKNRPDGKPFNANQLKAFSLIEGDTYTPSIYELISLEGRNSLKAKNPAMEEAWVKFNNARGMQSVRLHLNDAEYKRQILKYSPTVVQRKNDLGGLRIYSFSDMEMFHLIDIIQVITDSATVGLSLQGYTKVNEYAKAVKDTGEKLNRSLIPKGDLGYHIEDGRVVLDFDTVEGIDINHPDFFDNINNPNVGNIVIGINATQIKAAMTSKFIDQIIPFHTGQSNEVLGEKGIAAWDNYKDFQSERDVKTNKKSSHQINIYTEVINAAEAEGKPIKNKVDFVNKFLEVCKENNLIPRFSEFLNVDENGNYVYTEGYHKFLVDFKTFDQNTGEYLPQMPVKPVFENDYITSLLTDYVKSQKVKDAEFTKAMPKVLDRITKEIVKSDGVKYSDRDYFAEDKYFKTQIAKWEELKHGSYVKVGQIGEKHPLHSVGMPTGVMRYDVSKLKKNMADHGDYLTIELLKAIPDIIANPVAIAEYSAENTVNVFGDVFVGNSPMMVGVTISKDRAGNDISKVRTLNARRDVGSLITDDTVLYLDEDKKRTRKWFQACGKQVPLGETKFGFIRSISQTSDFVNRKFSDRESYAPTFYSHMGNVIDGIKLDKMGAGGVVSYLKGRGVKDEEIKWSGIETFLEGKKSVTKAELQEFVAGSQLQIEEEMSGDILYYVESDDDTYTERDFKERAYELAIEEGYEKDEVSFESFGEGIVAYVGRHIEENEILSAEKEESGGRWSQYKLDGGTNYRELVFKMPNSSYSNRAMRVHWGEDAEGILVHARVQDFDVDGKKMLFIEELQSDWHNEGHQKGYTTEEYEDAVAVYDKLAEDYANKRKAFNKYVRSSEFRSDPDEVGKKKFDWLRSKMETAEKRMQDAERDVEALKRKGMGDVADAPFRSTYHEYVLKRLLRMAAEEGYDSIGWTPSEIQSERWSDEFAEGYRIEYDQDMPRFLRKYGKKWGATVGKTNLEKGWAKANEQYIASQKEYISGWQEALSKAESDSEADFIRDQIKYHEQEIKNAQVDGETVWSMDITDSMKDSVLYEGQVFYSDRVTDKKTLDFLENQEHVTVYRAMQVIDGDLYPPMAAKVKSDDGKKKLVTPSKIGAWEQAVERPDLIRNGNKFELDKANGSSIQAAYNPYFHTSASPLNDQFSSAHKRPNLVIVEGEIPASELTSGYRAEFAKDTVGETKWHSGPVASKLKGDKARRVFLSRWFKPVRIVPDSEVASIVAKTLKGENIDVPYNVVTPSLRTELEKVGVSIKYSDRDPDSFSNRSLLANALESVAQNDIERNKLAQYKEKISLIESEQAKLSELRGKIKELSFAKGSRDTEAIKKLQFEANQAANRINTYDRQLLNLESTTALKGVLDREKQMAYKRAEQKGKEALKAQREKDRERNTKTQRELMNRYQESRKKNVENRHKTEMRYKIKGIVSELNNLLLNPTAKKHIKEELRIEVADALSAINMDTVGADERVAKYDALIAREKDPDIIAELTKTRDNIQLQGDNLKEKLNNLQSAYEKIKNTDDVELNLAYQEVIQNSIKAVSEKVGNTSIRNMTLEQLEMVYDLFKMIRHTIRDANKSFKEKKGLTIMQMAEAVNDQVRTVGGQPYKHNAISANLQRAGWTFLKPYVAFRTIGSVTFTNMYKELRNGEDTFYEDVKEAQTFIEEQYKKHGYKSWDMKETKTFTAKSGKTFDLTLEQMMTLYAYSRREQAHKHIIEGGIVLEDALITEKNKLGIPIKYEVTTKDAFNLSEETFKEISDSLTAEQKAFVDEMQTYLSDTMGAKGNEVSMKLLGVKLFKEKFYLPIKSSQFYMNFKAEEAGEVKLRSPAFSKETVKHANNPIVLHNFTDLWAEHINDMSMYHSFVLALEDFTKVYNYKTKTDAKVETMDTKATIETAYPGATKYINKFLKDMNGGVRGETVGWAEKLTSLSKKGAVLGSMSVTIQQPSAVMRATAYINPKYFVTTAHKSVNLVKHKQDFAELKKYAPIAGIKEMGRFDVGMGQGTVDWIKSNKTAMEKVEEIISVPPAYMDEITWVSIWNAVKRETVHTHKDLRPNSEEFLEVAGERFTEIISLSQVYDSVFSRSDLMRNKSWIAKSLTAFMAEPSTTLNMIWDSWVTAKRSGSVKGFVKATTTTGGAIVAATVLNAALKSIIMAMRDDDEDQSYIEKYLEHFFGDLKDSLNPLNLVPIVKDVVSIFNGYDVERMDMALISDLKNALDAFDSDSKTAYEKWSGLIGAISALFGVPIKNVERDIRGLITTVFGKTENTTKGGIANAITEGWTGESKSNDQQLYEAIVSGDKAQIERVSGRYEDQSAINSAIRSYVGKKYKSGEISRSEASKIITEYGGYDSNEAYWKLREWDFRIANGEEASYSKYTDFYNAVKTGKNLKAVIKEYTDHGVKTETLASQITAYYKPLYKSMSAKERASIKGYLLNAYTLLGYSRSQKSKDIDDWLEDK